MQFLVEWLGDAEHRRVIPVDLPPLVHRPPGLRLRVEGPADAELPLLEARRGGAEPQLRLTDRQPETTVLYQVVAEHLATFLARTEADPDRPGLPSYVRRELERYLSCGVPAAGFCRVHCDSCRTTTIVAFSCKARAVCPSCTGRRMAEVGAHLGVGGTIPQSSRRYPNAEAVLALMGVRRSAWTGTAPS